MLFNCLVQDVDCVAVPALCEEAQAYMVHCGEFASGISLCLLEQWDGLVVSLSPEEPYAVVVFEPQIGGVIVHAQLVMGDFDVVKGGGEFFEEEVIGARTRV